MRRQPATKARTKHLLWSAALFCCSVLLAVLIFFTSTSFTIGNKSYGFSVQNVSGKSVPFDDEIFIATGWDGPTGSFSHGQLYGVRIAKWLLKIDIVEDPIATTKKQLPSSVPELIKLVDSPDHWTSYCAALVLREKGASAKDAIPALVAKSQENPNMQTAVSDIAKAAGSDAVPHLVAGLNHSNPDVRMQIAEVLGELGSDAHGAIPALEAMLNETNSSVALQAALSLWKISGTHEKVLPTLDRLIATSDPVARAGAIFAMGELGPASSNAVPRLIAALSDEDMHVRAMSARTLGLIGAPAIDAIPSIIELSKTADPNVRMFAVGALKQFGTNAVSAIPLLAAVAKESDSAHVAIEALNAIGTPALPALLDIYHQSEGQRKRFAAIGIMRMGSNAAPALPVLLKDLQVEKPGTVALALEVIGAIGEPARVAIPEINSLLDEEDMRIRPRAAQALWRLDKQTNAVLPVLIASLAENTGSRRIAAAALAEMGSAAKEALPALRTAARDEQTNVRNEINDAIQSIETAISEMREE